MRLARHRGTRQDDGELGVRVIAGGEGPGTARRLLQASAFATAQARLECRRFSGGALNIESLASEVHHLLTVGLNPDPQRTPA